MRIGKNIKRFLLNMDVYHRIRWINSYEVKKIEEKRTIWENTKISEEDMKAIRSVFGNDVDVRWHRYFASFTGKMDPKYLPENIFSSAMEWRINPYRLCNELEDKALLETVFSSVNGIRIPKTIIKKSYGKCVGINGEILDEKNRVSVLREYLIENHKAILKPTRDTSSGRGVTLLTLDNYENVLDTVIDNYIIQEVITNQKDICCLNSSSLNTFRIMTYVCNHRINIAPILLRMGVGDNIVDNAHAGGIFIGVNSDGSLCEEAFSEYGKKYAVHPTSKIVFKNHRIQGIDLLEKAAIDCHTRILQLGMVSWDFTLDNQGIPTLIEANLFGQSVWLPQIAHGKSIFGDNTEEMLKTLSDDLLL